MRENAGDIAIGLCFACDWLKEWRESLSEFSERNHRAKQLLKKQKKQTTFELIVNFNWQCRVLETVVFLPFFFPKHTTSSNFIKKKETLLHGFEIKS